MRDTDLLRVLVQEKALVRMLLIIDETGRVSTRRLLERLGANGLHRLIKQAEEQGFIKREKVPPEGKGNHLLVNYLTPKGRRLVRLAREVQA